LLDEQHHLNSAVASFSSAMTATEARRPEVGKAENISNMNYGNQKSTRLPQRLSALLHMVRTAGRTQLQARRLGQSCGRR
jgi:hypothetical protein